MERRQRPAALQPDHTRVRRGDGGDRDRLVHPLRLRLDSEELLLPEGEHFRRGSEVHRHGGVEREGELAQGSNEGAEGRHQQIHLRGAIVHRNGGEAEALRPAAVPSAGRDCDINHS